MHTASNAPCPRRLSSMPRSGRSGMNLWQEQWREDDASEGRHDPSRCDRVIKRERVRDAS